MRLKSFGSIQKLSIWQWICPVSPRSFDGRWTVEWDKKVVVSSWNRLTLKVLDTSHIYNLQLYDFVDALTFYCYTVPGRVHIFILYIYKETSHSRQAYFQSFSHPADCGICECLWISQLYDLRTTRKSPLACSIRIAWWFLGFIKVLKHECLHFGVFFSHQIGEMKRQGPADIVVVADETLVMCQA